MKKFYFIIFVFFVNFTVSKSNEPFVVLEYKGDMSQILHQKLIKIINLLRIKIFLPLT